MTTPRDPVQFTRESAERVANVVRTVELAPTPGRPLSFSPVMQSQSRKMFRVCTFTGAWSINSEKVVTLKYQTATPNTVSATNLFFPITSTATSSTDCAVAKDGTAWFLIDVPLATATAIFVTGTERTAVVSDVKLTASLNTANCTVSIGRTLVTASRIFVTATVTGTFLQLRAL